MNNLIPLIIIARTSDKIAYNAIVKHFQDMAVGYAYSILKDFHFSQDAAQEAFLAAFRDLPSLRSPEVFPAWLKSIVFKHCNRMTRKKKHELVSIDTTIFASKDLDPLSQIEKEESRKRILMAINNLPEDEREAITLFYIGEHTHTDIAHFLNLSEATIKNRLRSARKRLKKGLIGMAKETMRQQASSRDNVFMKRIAEMLENAWAVRRAENYEEGRRILKKQRNCAQKTTINLGAEYMPFTPNMIATMEIWHRHLN